MDIFFPPICLYCERYLENKVGDLVCSLCISNVRVFSIFQNISPKIMVAHLGSYEDPILRRILHALKYEKRIHLTGVLDKLIARYISLNPFFKGLNYDFIIPIPLHPRRERDRGFNQSSLIAELIGKRLSLPVYQGFLKRIKMTSPQVEMKNEALRRENIKDCFAISEIGRIKNKNIIVVDDVYTSGATTAEAVKMLKKAGASKIAVFVIAKT